MIPDNVQRVLNKLSRIDIEAAEYVKQIYLDGEISKYVFIDDPLVVASFFTWSSTPQGWEYWNHIGKKYKDLPNVTKKGNIL